MKKKLFYLIIEDRSLKLYVKRMMEKRMKMMKNKSSRRNNLFETSFEANSRGSFAVINKQRTNDKGTEPMDVAESMASTNEIEVLTGKSECFSNSPTENTSKIELKPPWKVLNEVQDMNERIKDIEKKVDILKSHVTTIRNAIGLGNAPPALHNLGLNCYLNSAVQGMASCSTFAKDIDHWKKRMNKCPQAECSSLNSLHDMLQILKTDDIFPVKVSNDTIFTDWVKQGQQDSFELLSYIVNQFYKEIRRFTEEEGIVKSSQDWYNMPLPMRIKMVYHIKCKFDHLFECPIQTDIALHLTIPNDDAEEPISIETLINHHFEEEEILSYSCDKENCNSTTAAKMLRLLGPVPETLCLHLQRTFWNGNIMKKIERRVKICKKIKLKDKYFHGLKESFLSNIMPKASYALVSVIVHHGNASGGHYYCYRYFKDRWYRVNDERVNNVREEEVLDSNPVIVFYELQ